MKPLKPHGLSVVIVNQNSAKNLKKALSFLLKTKHQGFLEIIIVDNGEYYKQKRQSLKNILGAALTKKADIIVSPRNLGFGRACNLAVQKTTQSNLLFLNPDCFLSPKATNSLLAMLNKTSFPAIIVPTLIASSGKKQKYAFGRVPFWQKLFLTKKASFSSKQKPPVVIAKEADWLSGACLILKRKTFLDLNGFDSSFFLYFEDKDLCFRAREKGVRLLVATNIFAKHLESQSRISFSQRKRYYYRSQNIFLQKHFHPLFAFLFCFFRWPAYLKNVYQRK